MQVSVVIYTLPNCAVCSKLWQTIEDLEQLGELEGLEINVIKAEFGEPKAAYYHDITPRMFPTVIAFLDKKAALGWEGFAAFAPHEIEKK
jgi:hypothetical protein